MKSLRTFRYAILLSLLVTMLCLVSCESREYDALKDKTSDEYRQAQEKKEQESIIIDSFVADSEIIYDDNGATSVILDVKVVKVEERSTGIIRIPQSGQVIIFSCNIPQVRFETIVTGEEGGIIGGGGTADPNARFTTDGNGVVKARVRLVGTALGANVETRPVVIDALLNYEPKANLTLTLQKEPDITEIEFIDPLPDDVVIGQRIELLARPFAGVEPNKRPVSDGVRVRFNTSPLGYFEDANGIRYNSSISVPCSGGVAQTIWVAGTTAGKTFLHANISTITSDRDSTNVQPGVARLIIFGEHESTVAVSGPSQSLTTTVTDMFGNLLSGKMVRFTSKTDEDVNIGNITSSANTNSSGVATATFTPGISAGNAIITATCGDSAVAQTMITIESTVGQYLQFVNENPIELNVIGTGGTDSASIGVKVIDMSGNTVTTQSSVRFRVLAGPQGLKIQNQDWSPTLYYTATTYGGIAHVSISSGVISGTVQLEAELLQLSDPQNPNSNLIPHSPAIKISRRNILVHAGPPARVSFYIPNETTGRNIGAGAWLLVAAANITDTYGNPVSAGTGVTFSVSRLRKSEHNTNASYSLSPIYINAAAYVGNRSADDDSTAGIAYTYITYHGSYTNWWIDVSIDLNDIVVPDTAFQFPMQAPILTVIAQPEVIQWIPGETAANIRYKFTTIVVKVTDGQNNPLFNVPLEFTANAGVFSTPPSSTIDSFRDGSSISIVQMNEWEVPTEWQVVDPATAGNASADATQNTPYAAPTGENGIQRKKFYYDRELFNPMDPAIPRELTATVSVQILGVENTVRTVEIIFRNWL